MEVEEIICMYVAMVSYEGPKRRGLRFFFNISGILESSLAHLLSSSSQKVVSIFVLLINESYLI